MNPHETTDYQPDSAILLADWPGAGREGAGMGSPNSLLPLGDKPMLQRTIERLARLGCRTITVIPGDDALAYRSFLGDGERWGCRIDYIYRQPEETIGLLLRRIGLDTYRQYWLADPCQLPSAEVLETCRSQPANALGSSVFRQEGSMQTWTGWGLFSGEWLLGQTEVAYRDDFVEALRTNSRILRLHAVAVQNVVTLSELLASSRTLLQEGGEESYTQGRNCRIARTARILPPVRLGNHVRIAKGATIGPNVVIGDGAQVDEGTHLEDCVVLPDTYVGDALDLKKVVAGGNRLAHVGLDTVVEVVDSDLLCSLPGRLGQATLREKWFAHLLRPALYPLYRLSLAFGGGETNGNVALAHVPVPRTGQAGPGEVRLRLVLPQQVFRTRAPRPWLRHFCQTIYPGLAEVVRGNVRLVGPTLRGLQEVRQLPDHWRRLYGETHCGLLNEMLISAPAAANADEQFASDALAAAQQGQRHVARTLLRRYLGRVLRDFGRAMPSPQPDSTYPEQVTDKPAGNDSSIHHRYV